MADEILTADAEDEQLPCSICGETDTVEIFRGEQSILVCAECGAD
jgi:translation initiation factor 2 beta subunit (eIF-2beta)/eIF-5